MKLIAVILTTIVFSIFVATLNAISNKRDDGDPKWDEFAHAMILGAIASVVNLILFFCFKYLSTLNL